MVMPDEEKKRKITKCDPREYSEVLRTEKLTKNPLASYMPFPRVNLEIQEESEEILLLVRRHIITNWRWILIALIMSVAPLFFSGFPGISSLPDNFQLMTGVLWYLLVLAVLLEGFLNWYFDVFIITDERIIDIDFKNLIYKNITSTKLDNVEDVTYSVSGALPSLLDYGNVLIQTAGTGYAIPQSGTQPSIEISSTPHPSRVAKLVNELLIQEEQEKLEGRVR
jgi:hypothetical protein